MIGFKKMAIISFVAAAFIVGNTAQAGLLYNIIDLGTMGVNSYGYGINSSGQVTGYSQAGAFVTDLKGQMINLGEGIGYSINDLGQVTGATGTWRGRAFVTDSSGAISYFDEIRDTGPQAFQMRFSAGYGINDSGVVAGGAATTFSITYGFHANTGGSLVQIGVELGNMDIVGAGMGINEAGQITGTAGAWTGTSIYDHHSHAYITNSNGNIIKDLGTLGGFNSYGNAINNLGQVTGSSETRDGNVHAFVTNVSGQMIDLGTLGGSYSAGLSINTTGQVVGNAGGHDFVSHAFVTENGLMQDLNTLLVAKMLGWELIEARGINDLGQITGSGIISGETHAYLLTPVPAVPEPAVVWLLVSGLGLMTFTRRKNQISYLNVVKI